MRVLDLFSGIGGFSLGLERAGMETVAFCEIEAFLRKVLNKHWPEIPIYDDVRTITRDRLREDGIGSIDVVCGGFPCQPFSVAGKQGGFKDDRDLWPEMFRVIQEVKPRWVIGENVAGFVNMGLERTIANLESEAYEVQSFVIPACAVGAPHRRDRVWIVAHDEKRSHRKYSKKQAERQKQKPRESDCRDAMANSNNEGLQGADYRELEYGDSAGCSQWAVEPDVGRVAHGIPRRVDRLKGLGNAVVPQIPEIIGRAIMNIEQGVCA